MAEERVRERTEELERELKHSRAHEKTLSDLLEKKLNELYVHYHISRTIGSVHDLRDMLEQVIAIIRKSLPLERISVYLLDEKREALELVYYSGPDLGRKIRLPFGEGTPGRVVESGEHVHIHDLSVFYGTFNDFVHHPDEEKRGGAYIGIALKVHNAVIGMIGMDNGSVYGLNVDDMDFMAILSHQLAAGIEKSRLFEKIQRLSQQDGLTGLYNHRVFQERLLQEIKRRGRNQRPLSLMMLDIDHFKRFNDTYGHQAGDAVLKELSALIVSHTRGATIDVCCRYGGEEFAVIMPELDKTQAMKVAERLRKAVEVADFTLPDQKTTSTVTVSIGVACLAGEEQISPKDLIKKADDALFVSKRNGKNRVSLCPESS